ncbi:hypothetical protein GW846_03680 [Candidatus Gracilibacteria bacterium]|nr:hypothetical protein [Candidatus Gracilibacteria bacterium]
MKYDLKATSIIEAMVVLLIVVTGIIGVYGLLNSSQRLANSTGNRIEAISIARDGLESFSNIRDTNWIRFSADTRNCWNVLNYNINCLGNSTTTYDIRSLANQSYSIYRNAQNQFELSLKSNLGDFDTPSYRNDFKVQKDARGFYTQSGGVDINPLYTREIIVEYIEDTNSDASINSNDAKMRVSSLVQWRDVGNENIKTLTLQTVLTNWYK